MYDCTNNSELKDIQLSISQLFFDHISKSIIFNDDNDQQVQVKSIVYVDNILVFLRLIKYIQLRVREPFDSRVTFDQ